MVLVACGVARQQACGCSHQVTHAALQRHAPLDDGGPDMADIARGQRNQRHAVAKTQHHRRVGRAQVLARRQLHRHGHRQGRQPPLQGMQQVLHAKDS